jgi:peptidyl-prolyl cis-trans isomerase SurA
MNKLSRGFQGLFFTWVLLMTGMAQAEVVDRVIAVVNQEPITLYDLENFNKEHQGDIKEFLKNEKNQKSSGLSKNEELGFLIETRLLEQKMDQMKVQVTDADLEKAMQNILKRNNFTKEQLIADLNHKGVSFEKYNQDLRVQLKKLKFMGQVIAPKVRVTNADLDEFFAEHSEHFSNYQSVEIAQVILPLSATASESERQVVLKKADEVAKKAKDGDKFEGLGKKYSMNPQTAEKGFYPVSQLAPTVAKAIEDLKPGQISRPVRSSLGIHIVKLFSRKTLAGDEYQALREQIREKVFEEKMQDELESYIKELKAKSYIEVKPVS